MRVTNLGTAILSVFLDSASDLPQARVQSKPDPFAILSVGKTSRQTAALRRTDAPVWEQGFTFLVNIAEWFVILRSYQPIIPLCCVLQVGNPENDTLQVKIIDQKTEKDLGQFTYILSTLLTKNDLQVVSQPFQLQKSGPNSKVIMSMALKILKKSANEPREPVSDGPIFNRQASQASMIQRQASQASQSDIPEVKNVKLAEFPKVAEVPSESSSGVETIIEKAVASGVSEFISNEAANVQKDDPPQSELRRRQLSTESSVSGHGLGRIQITLQYSVQRQRLSVTVHRITWVEICTVSIVCQ